MISCSSSFSKTSFGRPSHNCYEPKELLPNVAENCVYQNLFYLIKINTDFHHFNSDLDLTTWHYRLILKYLFLSFIWCRNNCFEFLHYRIRSISWFSLPVVFYSRYFSSPNQEIKKFVEFWFCLLENSFQTRPSKLSRWNNIYLRYDP